MSTILHEIQEARGEPPMLTEADDGAIAWTRASLATEAGRLSLDGACLGELAAAAETLDTNPMATIALTPDDFEMPACRALMRRAQAELEDGVGFVVIDRLPMDRLEAATAKALYWILAHMLARPVAQNWAEGALIYDVYDSGKPFGYGVRPDVTNRHQNFHTDNSYNLCPPRYVALLCLQKAVSGGLSGVVSFVAAHNEMRRRHPELLGRLYRPYLFDRQREHGPDDHKVVSHPLLSYDGGMLRARLSRGRVLAGYALAETALEPEGRAALEAFESILEDPALNVDLMLEPGQIEIVDNFRCGHRRTAFKDGPDRKRRLVRLWLRDQGRRFYNG
ncbi:MAG: TauD/TfdA family dioxygenase [Alphaproteobacteria bacterium]|nr:TauD/TfdA family dioxygenase [Alphaproteobacteria bacterium]